MGFASYYEDNLDARGESLRRSSRQQTKKTEKEPTVSKSEKSRQTQPKISQFKLRRSTDSMRVNRVTRCQKKSQRTQPKISRQTQPKQSQRLTPDDIQQYLLERKGKPFRTVSDWAIDIQVHFERSNHVSLPQQGPLHRFVRLALNYLKRSKDAAEDAEGRWKII